MMATHTPNYFNSSALYLFDVNTFFEGAPELKDDYVVDPIFEGHDDAFTFALGYTSSGITWHWHLDSWLEVHCCNLHLSLFAGFTCCWTSILPLIHMRLLCFS